MSYLVLQLSARVCRQLVFCAPRQLTASAGCHTLGRVPRSKTLQCSAGSVVGSWVLLALATCCLSCGSSPSAPTEAEATITIGPAGVTPREVRIDAWGQVKFVNNDSEPHSIVSDPVDLHSQCPQLNQIGILQPGDSRISGTLNLTGACGFHDHLNKMNDAWRGRIVVK